ncbi:DUF3087 family protein [Halomonas saccharevitans]|uniref:DUF3087 family protein n=1 Tax=Halomonas saccharevitans TaxID=416872 RepID=A0A1I7B7E3_9GAMM|nr:DUF3087 family protein [Halomonas saccharevitans]MDT8880016.1 DUF3087 family protein [Halomonas saccharevitans]SFT83067.1 Protein of unknown function [Halomonas saccharevitans]
MTFRFEHHDPATYRRLSRLTGLAMAGQLIVFGLLFSQLLVAAFGGSLWINALGVLLGLAATSLVFAVLRQRPWMAGIRYVWRLKHHLARVSAYLPALRRGMGEGDEAALAVLAFYHQGMAQLSELEGRTLDDDAELLAEREVVRHARRERGLSERVEGFELEDLSAFRKG